MGKVKIEVEILADVSVLRYKKGDFWNDVSPSYAQCCKTAHTLGLILKIFWHTLFHISC